MPRTILVIDDNPLVLEVVQRMLRSRGYAVLAAPDGRQGLDLLAEHAVDAAIVDVDMPGMDGIDVCRVLRDRNAAVGGSLSVWLMTGVARPERMRHALAAGARGILPKPFRVDELVRCLEGARAA